MHSQIHRVMTDWKKSSKIWVIVVKTEGEHHQVTVSRMATFFLHGGKAVKLMCFYS